MDREKLGELLRKGNDAIREYLGPPDDPRDPELYEEKSGYVDRNSEPEDILRHSYNLEIKYYRVKARIEAVSILDENGKVDEGKKERRVAVLHANASSYLSTRVDDDEESIEMDIKYINGEVTNEEAIEAYKLQALIRPEPSIMEALEIVRQRKRQQA